MEKTTSQENYYNTLVTACWRCGYPVVATDNDICQRCNWPVSATRALPEFAQMLAAEAKSIRGV